MNYNTYNDLYHFGVKGMKWGIRRNRKPKITENDYHDDYKRAHKKESVKVLSDNELRSRINRLQMESQYSKLNKENSKRGIEYINKFFKAGTTVATVTTTALTIYGNFDKISKIVGKYTKKI